MMRDLHHNATIKRVISPVAVGTTGTGKTGQVIDLQGYNGCEFVIGYGSVTATNAAFTFVLTECDTSNGSFTSVADSDMLGSTPEASAGLAQAASRASGTSKNVTKKLGYVGSKRYLQPKLSSTVTAGALVHVDAILFAPRHAPVP